MEVIHSNMTAILTHAILAPDTAMLKPICFFPCPFDTPLMSGLNFLRISDVHKSSKNYKRSNTCFVTVQVSHLVVLICMTYPESSDWDLLGNVVTVSSVLSPPMLVNRKKNNQWMERLKCIVCKYSTISHLHDTPLYSFLSCSRFFAFAPKPVCMQRETV